MKPMGGHYYSREKLRSRLLNRSLTQASFLHLAWRDHILAYRMYAWRAMILGHSEGWLIGWQQTPRAFTRLVHMSILPNFLHALAGLVIVLGVDLSKRLVFRSIA